MDADGYDLLGFADRPEGLLGVITEVTVRILPRPETARGKCWFASNEDAGRVVAAIIAFAPALISRGAGNDGQIPSSPPPRNSDTTSAGCRGAADRRAGRPGGGKLITAEFAGRHRP
ncbi:MAG: hypothetical protein IPK48_00145 [Gammaproteobacteria bacterium]|nr:hypothetical protein [Gammaproteobacteria bacterium]